MFVPNRTNQIPWYKTGWAICAGMILFASVMITAAGGIVTRVVASATLQQDARQQLREERYQKCVGEATRGEKITAEIMLACTTTVKEIFR
jgi:hypothetical protein